MRKNQKYLRQESIALFQNTETTNDTILARNCNIYKKDEINQTMPNYCSQIQSVDKSGKEKISSKAGKALGMIFPIILTYTSLRHIYFSRPH